MYNTKLSEIMTTALVTVAPEDNLEVVDRIFKNNSFHHLPVVDKERNLLGILSKSDYLTLCDSMSFFQKESEVVQNSRMFKSILVKDVMHKNVARLKPDNTVMVAAGFFKENLFHAIPIIDESSKLVGIVTTFDLINLAFSREPLKV